ncbi:MAG: glycosyltransferase [Maribacter sp.]|nr:glycosyltransferase [Maribacter sp.]
MISIIIPAHNEGPNLRKLLEKTFIEAALTAEIIVALSPYNSDGSEKISVPKGVRFLHCSQMGRALQMNEAALNANGDILAFLHADVIPPDSFVLDIERTIKEGYEAGFFSYRFDNENFWLKINASFTTRDGIFTGGGDQCLFIGKSAFNALGGFNIKQVLMEDFEFFDRMKKRNIRYKIIKNQLIVSARKYRYNSYLRVNISNLLLLFLFKGGYPAIKLKALHDKLIRTPYQRNSL